MQLMNKKQSTSRWVPGKTLLLVKWEDHSASKALKGESLAATLLANEGKGTVIFMSAGFFIQELNGNLVMTETMEDHEHPYVGMVRTIIATDIVELKVL